MGAVLIVIGVICVAAGVVICMVGSSGTTYDPLIENESDADDCAFDHNQSRVEPTVNESNPIPEQLTVRVSSRKENTDVNTDVEVSDQDDNHAKGEAFERFVVSRFDRKYWSISDWRSDKGVDGRYAESAMKPDLVMCLHLKDDKHQVAVECKWRKEAKEGKVKWSYPEQLARYRKFASETEMPVFVAIGIGGSPSAPESVYLVPLSSLRSHVADVSYLEHWSHNPEKNIYYDTEGKRLR